MRLLATALIALASLTWTAAPADARSRTQQTQAQTRSTAPQAARAAAAPRGAAAQQQARSGNSQANRATAARRSAGQQNQVAGRGAGRQTRQQAAAACRGRNCGSAPRQVSWQSGLAPATNEQAQACPAGTLATLARGHADIVRCMPL